MDFKRARSKQQFEQRENDIISVAISIYKELGFEGVTFSKISEKTNFTRPTIYSYFKTKEEIMLKLTNIYLEKFTVCFEEKLKNNDNCNNEFIAQALTGCFVEIPEFIHLYTVLFSIIEKNVSVEALADFKQQAMVHHQRLSCSLKKVYKDTLEDDIAKFLLFCLCFASGLCPMSEQTEIQKQAIQLSETGYKPPDFEQVFKDTILIYLNNLKV